MEKVLRPERLDVSPNTVNAPRAWRHWLATFENFIESLQRPDENLDKLRILTNFVAPEIYEFFLIPIITTKLLLNQKLRTLKLPTKSLQDILYRHESKSQKNLLTSTCVYSPF